MQLDATGTAALSLHLLGPLNVSRAGVAVALPPSRKVRALLAYLAMAGRPLTRSHLCELLWDVPSDPRWCLSKLRAVLDDPSRMRVQTSADTVALDLADCSVDASEVVAVVQQGIAS